MIRSLFQSLLTTIRTAVHRRFDRLHADREQPLLSIIVCSVDDQRFARCRANWRKRLGDRRYELIRIADARSLAEGYNRGLQLSRGALLVFCHDDIEILQADIYTRIAEHLKSADVIGVAGTSRLVDGSWLSAGQPDIHGQVVQPAQSGEGVTLDVFGLASQATGKTIQALDGLFLAMNRSVAESLHFDAVHFDGFHLYDIDFTFRAHLARFRLAVCHNILIYHQSRGQHNDAWRRYRAIFERQYAGQLSPAPVSAPHFYSLGMRDKDEALAQFQNLSLGQGVIVANV